MPMTQVLFSGCSICEGHGLDGGFENPSHYSQVLAKAVFDTDCAITNIGVGGYSNLRIFLDTCSALLQRPYDYAFVGVTGYPRYVIDLGLEPYATKRMFNSSTDIRAHLSAGVEYTGAYLTDVKDRFLELHHDHQEIVDIVQYVNILLAMGQNTGTRIYFLNTIANWDHGFFERIQHHTILPESMTAYTRHLINIDHRGDEDCNQLYHRIHDEYQHAGGVQSQAWLNLYTNMTNFFTDQGTDKLHPGPESHKSYGSFLAQCFREINA
jgi:hypothetical protein